MSRQIALETINLMNPRRPAHTEYAFQHDELIKYVSGEPENNRLAHKKFYEAWDIDLIWHTNDGPVPWSERGRVTNMGHGSYTEDARDLNVEQQCPFEDVEEVLEFDAVKEYGLADFRGLVKYYEHVYAENQEFFAGQLFPGGYYKTLISGALETFGWDMLLMAANEQERFAKVLQSFGNLTMHHIKAWSATSIEVFTA